MRNLLSLIPITGLMAGLTGQSAQASPQPRANFADLAAQCAPAVHIRTLSSLVRQESQMNPYAINVNGGYRLARQPATMAEAAAVAQSLLDRGYSIDVGLGQINLTNRRASGASLARLFAPCVNLRASARILAACYRRGVAASGEGQRALHAALSCYNTGSLRKGIQNGYVRKTLAQARLPVPEAIPLAGEDTITAPMPLGARNAGEPDVFRVSVDRDAFSDGADNNGLEDNNQK